MHIRSFFNGVLAGVILGILFAPASGEATRRKLAKKANDIQEAADESLDKAISSLQDEETPVMAEAPLLVTVTALVVENGEQAAESL